MSMGKFHFPKNTVEATCWCDPCGRETRHSVHDGRRGACLVCLAKREEQAANRTTAEPVETQANLFNMGRDRG